MDQAGHLTTQDRMRTEMLVVSMMICNRPRMQGSKIILSASDSVWEAVDHLPTALTRYLTDDLGNRSVDYGGFVYITDYKLFDELALLDLFSCLRSIRTDERCRLEIPLARDVREFGDKIHCVGWDVVCGNGWVSASCDGVFPLDVFATEDTEVESDDANSFGLLASEEVALKYCAINDKEVPKLSPWYPVAIYLDKSSFVRLTSG